MLILPQSLVGEQFFCLLFDKNFLFFLRGPASVEVGARDTEEARPEDDQVM